MTMKPIQISIFLTFLFYLPLHAQTFQHDAADSFSMAKDSSKEVLMIFSGSDWCKPCMQLRQSILESEAFSTFSDKQLVLLELDFPYRKKNQLPKEQQEHNEQLAEKYNQEGSFPKVILLNSDQVVLGQITYKNNMTTQQFIDQITALQNQ